MIAYRVETKDTRAGPYHTAYREILDTIGVTCAHPAPQEDPILLHNACRLFRQWEDIYSERKFCWLHFVFCFTSIESFHNWFSKKSVIRALKAKNLHLAVYDVPDKNFVNGRYQAMILKSEHANLLPIQTFELDEV